MANEQTIQKFYSQVQTADFARQFQFRITQLANTNFGTSENIYLETANLPGRAITNVPVPFMGLQFNVPGTATYPGSDAWAVTFRSDQNYLIRAALEACTFITFDDATSTGDYNIARNGTIIELDLLGKEMEIVRTYQLIGAYVVSVGDMAYNLGDSGSVATVPATLAYQYWRLKTSAANSNYAPQTGSTFSGDPNTVIASVASSNSSGDDAGDED